MQVAQNHRGGDRVRLHPLQADAQHNGDHRCTVDSAQRRRSTVHSDGVRTMQTLTSSDQHIVIAQLIAMRRPPFVFLEVVMRNDTSKPGN